MSIRATGYPVGAIVVHGAHAILAVGYQTTLDPLNENGQANTILGMDVWDPWYNAGFGNWSGGRPVASHRTRTSRSATGTPSTSLTDRNEGPVLPGQVRRRAAELCGGRRRATRRPQSYGDFEYDQSGAGASPSPTPAPNPFHASGKCAAGRTAPARTTASRARRHRPQLTCGASSTTIAQAVADGLTTYGLLGDR